MTSTIVTGHAPGNLRNAFDDVVEAFRGGAAVSPNDHIEDIGMTVAHLCEVLHGCTDIMSGGLADLLFDMERDVTFADGTPVPDRTYASGARYLLEATVHEQ